MRCKACNKPIENWVPMFHHPEDSSVPVMEDLCGMCLFIIRADLYDGGPPEAVDVLTHKAGIQFDYEPSQEG